MSPTSGQRCRACEGGPTCQHQVFAGRMLPYGSFDWLGYGSLDLNPTMQKRCDGLRCDTTWELISSRNIFSISTELICAQKLML
jgi:hypothetical protein